MGKGNNQGHDSSRENEHRDRFYECDGDEQGEEDDQSYSRDCDVEIHGDENLDFDAEEHRDELGPLNSRLLIDEEEDDAENGTSDQIQETTAFTQWYIHWLRRLRKWVIAFWLLMFVVGCVFAPKFLDVVLLVFEPPEGTLGATAKAKLETEFPGMSHESDTLVLMRTTDRSPILNVPSLRPFIQELSINVVQWGRNVAVPQTEFETIHFFFLRSLASHTLSHALLDNSTHPEQATAMIATLHLKSGFKQGSMEGQRFCNWLDLEVERLRIKHLHNSTVKVGSTGMLPFVRDMQQGTEEDMIHMDSLSFPLALGVLAYMLRSIRLLLIPIVSMLLSIVVSFTIMYPIALSTTVIAIAPSTMMSVAVAFSIDYSLFLLSSFRREIMRGASELDAVLVMSDTAGHTIMVSGATIAICWFGLLFFPVTLLSTIGLGAGLTVVVAFLVNISLTPALLLTFGRFFTNFEFFGCQGVCDALARLPCSRIFVSRPQNKDQVVNDSDAGIDTRGLLDNQHDYYESQADNGHQHPVRQTEHSHFDLEDETESASGLMGTRTHQHPMRSPQLSRFATPPLPTPSSCPPSVQSDGTVGQITSPVFGLVDPIAEIHYLRKTSSWFSCGERMYGTPLRALTAIIVVCAAILPLTPTSLSFHHSEDFKLFTPSSSLASKTAIEMEKRFGGGRLAPYELIIEPDENISVMSNHFFRHVQSVLHNVIMNLDYGENKPVALKPDGVSGPMMLGGANISFLPTVKDPQEQLSVAGCIVKDLGYIPIAFSVCTNSHCTDALAACRQEQNCERDLECFDDCMSSSSSIFDEMVCLTECAVMIDRKSNVTRNLGTCVLEECIEHPFKPSLNETGVLQRSRREDESLYMQSVAARSLTEFTDDVLSYQDLKHPDCPSVTLQFIESVHGRKLWPRSMCIMLNLVIDPFSQDGVSWLDSVREALAVQSAKDGYRYYLSGGDVSGHDTVNKVFELFPRVLSILASAILLILGVSYRSLAVPMTAVFTISLTLILVYALGVLVYEHGALEFLGIRALRNPIGNSLVWIVPALSAVVSSGLSTDYTVFGVDAVHHYRSVGFTTRDSILCGNGQTGGIITAAGIIMTFAFAGLSLSSNAALNQLSFFLVASVLADTFVIRTILMPAIMVILNEKNWWPMRPATIGYERSSLNH